MLPPIERRYVWPHFINWLINTSEYDARYSDPESCIDSMLYISHDMGETTIVDLRFDVDQEEDTLTITIIDPKPDTYDDLWLRILNDYTEWAQENSRNLPVLTVKLAYEYCEDDSEEIEL